MTGFIILVVLILLVIGIYMALAAIPGNKARERGHPQADAISVLGWIGLLPWVIALVWAHMTPVFQPSNPNNSDA